ncbi:unnamed protein product [Microthlaspi erraticum]|uniref:Phosphoglycerate kinase n=1 Tax=Microthlaspi erraticum TaxID=1685480 RepID=A0A6D2J4S8_9BRAS|nr:unnamed protein product [Microthlaspi erraticum]
MSQLFFIRFPVGSRVVGAFIMPCGTCTYCAKGHDDLCEDFFAFNRAKGTLYDGETRLFLRHDDSPVYMYSMGGMDEYCVTPAHGLAPLPESLPHTESAILGCPGDSIAPLLLSGCGGALLLENVRFYKEDEKKDPEFAKKLASLADLYVNDAFGNAHRANASTEGVTKFLKPSVAG